MITVLLESVLSAASEIANGRPRLEARALTRRFGGVAAVNDVSFTLGHGEILGLIGPNGAGKTTLFDLLAGTVAPTSGTVVIGGRSVEALGPHRRLAHGLGRTFQIPRPFPEMTVLENVLTARQAQAGERPLDVLFRPGLIRAEEQAAREKAGELLDFLTLGRLAYEPARVLSGGQRKLLELARVMMARPSIILLDEPAAGVHPTLLDVIADRIEAIHARGVAFLLIEHNIDLVRRLCGRVLVMAGGGLLCVGTPAEVTADARVRDAYLGGSA